MKVNLLDLINGEINVFRPEETRVVLQKAYEALFNGGHLVIEVHTLAAVRAIGENGSRWNALESELFSEEPHLMLKETYWDEVLRVATERYYIIDAVSGGVVRHAASIQGYTEKEDVKLLEDCGFGAIRTHPSLGGKDGERDKNYVVYVAKALQLE
jgi:hypothetical protein